MTTNTKQSMKLLLAAACCFALVLFPVLCSAQGGILKGAKEGVEKGAKGVQQGVETGAEKTKEGAEAVGHETKKVITGDESNSSENRMKSSEGQPETSSTETPSETQTETTPTGRTGRKHMPRTAGEMPLLVLSGLAALAGARATRRLK